MDPFIGEIKLVPYTFAPVGWMFCDGSLLSIAQNQALFSLLGTTYGGDGVTNFAVPDFRGQVGLSQGTSTTGTNYALGQHAGTPQVTLTTQQLPTHNHLVQVLASSGDQPQPAGHYLAGNKGGALVYAHNLKSPGAATPLSPTGGGGPHDNMQPYLALNYIIATEGIYPSQN